MTTTPPIPIPLYGGPNARRWECECRTTPVLLGTIEPETGQVNIRAGNRFYRVWGTVITECPRCRVEHRVVSGVEVGKGRNDG